MSEYKWECPRCWMKFAEINGRAGRAGKCATPGCNVNHGGAALDGEKETSKPWVRPGQTADLRRMER